MKLNNRSVLFAVILIVATVIVKLICAPKLELSGIATITAIALFAGMAIKNKNNSFVLPLIALVISDVVIEVLYQLNWFAFRGFYERQILNYALLLLAVLVGWLVKGKTYASIGIAAIVAPTLFFLLSNLEVWYNSTMYAQTWSGLVQCYVAALPFYYNSLLSTLIFLPVTIYLYNYLFYKKAKTLLA